MSRELYDICKPAIEAERRKERKQSIIWGSALGLVLILVFVVPIIAWGWKSFLNIKALPVVIVPLGILFVIALRKIKH